MRCILCLLICFWLAGCTTIPERPPVANPKAVWQERKQILTGLDNWHLTGRLSVANEEESWHVKLRWQQKQDAYNIDLNGPFGAGKMRLAGNSNGVVLHTKEGMYFADTPETLLSQHTGVTMPVSKLRYWILGIPSPTEQGNQQLDAYGRLKQLNQAGWDILLRRYVMANRAEVPNKLFMHKDDIEVRLVVEQWTFDNALNF